MKFKRSESASNQAYGVVYSSDEGKMCPICASPVARCSCRKAKGGAAGDGKVRVRREVKGRGGKTVSTISGLPLSEAALEELAVTLKKRCGSGGSAKDGIIIIQGDHVEAIVEELKKSGFDAKRGGG